MGKSRTTGKSAGKKAGGKAASARKRTAPKPVKKSGATRKTASRKAATGKPHAKKSTAKKAPAKKAPAKKAPAKRTKSPTARASTVKQKTGTRAKSAARPATKSPVKKPTAKKPTSKKTATKKPVAPAEKAPAKKTKTPKPAAKDRKAATEGKKARAAKPEKKAADRKRPRSVAEAASAAAADEKGYVFINGRRVRMISTQGLGLPKKPRAAAATGSEAVMEQVPAKPLKTRLTAKQLRHYRELLLAKRAELFGDLSAMEAEALRSSGGNISHMPIHMADIGTDTYDQDFMLGLAETERKQLREIDDALHRIEDKTYGVCLLTGKDIPLARLDAKPWAKYTIEAARMVESQMLS